MEWLNFSSIALILINTLATIFILKSRFLFNKQKLAQLIIIWAIPLIGALVVLNANMQNNRKARNSAMSHYYDGLPADKE